MANILDTILEEKYREVTKLKSMHPNGIATKNNANNSTLSFIKKLKSSDCIQVISEIKRGSPSKGLFAPNLDVNAQGLKYEQSGAGAISILTDEKFFWGNITDIRTLRPVVNLPILCKDFIVDEIQIDLAKSVGANIILLIVAAHSSSRLKELLDYSQNRGLEVLMEVHNKEELDIALSMNHELIGINNRNLKTFVTDLKVSLELVKYVDNPNVQLISESGIKTKSDVEKLRDVGFKGILVGESLIKNGLEGSLIEELTSIKGLEYV